MENLLIHLLQVFLNPFVFYVFSINQKINLKNFGQKILFIDEIQSDFEAAVRRGATKAEAPFTDSQHLFCAI